MVGLRVLILLALTTVTVTTATAADGKDQTKTGHSSGKTKIKYRSFTQIDFSEQTVEGKARSPEIFYIFQRKRASGYQIATTPKHLDEHRDETLRVTQRALRQ
ncbi:MAG: hypothetical protein AB1540_06305 [Bdellovibrionota bacterium]